MDILYRLEKATAREIHQAMTDAPSYTSVRSHLRAMKGKGYVTHSQEGIRYVYSTVVTKTNAKSSALKNLLTNFFDGSQHDLIATLIGGDVEKISKDELDQISRLIESTRKEGR